jgi:hypothetical protein
MNNAIPPMRPAPRAVPPQNKAGNTVKVIADSDETAEQNPRGLVVEHLGAEEDIETPRADEAGGDPFHFTRGPVFAE